jgi:hypothetical protein
MDGLYKLVSRRVRDTQIPSGTAILHVFIILHSIISHNLRYTCYDIELLLTTHQSLMHRQTLYQANQ